MSRTTQTTLGVIIAVILIIVLVVWAVSTFANGTPATPTKAALAPTATYTAVPPPAPTVPPSGGPSGVQVSGGTSGTQPAATPTQRTINLQDGRSIEPRRTLPLPELGFEPYLDTGIVGNATWNFNVPSGWTIIIGGVTVRIQGKTYDTGYIGARKGPIQLNDVFVANGFYTVKKDAEAEGEFCSRIAEAEAKGWLHNTIEPLNGWQQCW